MATPLWVRKMLELRGIAYTELRHPEAFTALEVARYEHFSGHRVAKVVVAIADGRPVELILPASRYVDLDRVREILEARDVRLATEIEMENCFPHCEPGTIPALRHWGKEVEVLMDPSLEVKGDILFQAGTHTDAVRLSFPDWFELVKPRVAAFTEAADPMLV